MMLCHLSFSNLTHFANNHRTSCHLIATVDKWITVSEPGIQHLSFILKQQNRQQQKHTNQRFLEVTAVT